MRRRGAVVTLALALSVSACVSGGSATTSAGTGDAAGDVVVGPDGAPTPSTAHVVDREMPFAPYAGAVAEIWNGDKGIDEAKFVAIEELVAACMKDEGWEYTPREYEPLEEYPTAWVGGVIALPVLPADRADVETFGYGTDDIETLETELAAHQAVEPNNVYLDGLAPAAQEAYLESMGGEAGGGCVDDATLEVLGAEPVVSDLVETYSELVWEMNAVVSFGVDGDPRGSALVGEWADCMADAGYDVTKPEDELGSGWPAGPMQAYDLAIGTAVDGTTDPAHRDMPSSEIPVDSRYLVGSDVEHAIALADFDCRASTDYVDRYLAVLTDLEADFVADRKVTLDELAAATASR